MSPGVATTRRGWGPERGQKTATGGQGCRTPPPSLWLTTNIHDLDVFIIMLTVLSTFQGTVQGH